jgi:carboxypeptidase C (cathepsin A)
MYKTEDPLNNPVTIWLNGGPGSSSVFGNFLENGPLWIKSSNSTGSVVYDVNNNPQGSWANNSTMIYVDQPIGTGFSYADPPEYLTNMDGAAAEFVTFMVNLYELYPEFKDRPLYMTGESYAGKYLPRYSNALLDSNTANNT